MKKIYLLYYPLYIELIILNIYLLKPFNFYLKLFYLFYIYIYKNKRNISDNKIRLNIIIFNTYIFGRF